MTVPADASLVGDGFDANGAPAVPDPSGSSPAVITAPAANVCKVCGGPLRGRQKAFCSDPHRAAWWKARNPTLQPRVRSDRKLVQRIRELYSDGIFRTDREGAAALGELEGSVAMRRRESGYPLSHPKGYGWKWEKRRRAGSREREHRLVSTYPGGR